MYFTGISCHLVGNVLTTVLTPGTYMYTQWEAVVNFNGVRPGYSKI